MNSEQPLNLVLKSSGDITDFFNLTLFWKNWVMTNSKKMRTEILFSSKLCCTVDCKLNLTINTPHRSALAHLCSALTTWNGKGSDACCLHQCQRRKEVLEFSQIIMWEYKGKNFDRFLQNHPGFLLEKWGLSLNRSLQRS